MRDIHAIDENPNCTVTPANNGGHVYVSNSFFQAIGL